MYMLFCIDFISTHLLSAKSSGSRGTIIVSGALHSDKSGFTATSSLEKTCIRKMSINCRVFLYEHKDVNCQLMLVEQYALLSADC